MTRVSLDAMEYLDNKDVYFVFPCFLANGVTRLVLKKPKTTSSIRTIWIPKTVAEYIRDWKIRQVEIKNFMGKEYTDYNLVLAQNNGRPVEHSIIEKKLNACNMLKYSI